MEKEKQRIAIAEACGWTRSDESYPYKGGICKRIVWRNPKGEPQPLGDDALPDYFGDLNAMHEAEKVLFGRRLDFAFIHEHLEKVIQRDIGTIASWYWNVHATAAQRAEAFVKTIGKLEDQATTHVDEGGGE